MSMFIRLVGLAWAFIGGGNIIMMPWSDGGEMLLAGGVIFNGVLFILPGLVVYGIGAMIASNKGAKRES